MTNANKTNIKQALSILILFNQFFSINFLPVLYREWLLDESKSLKIHDESRTIKQGGHSEMMPAVDNYGGWIIAISAA